VLNKVFGGGSRPLVSAFQDHADGPATRRHHGIDLGAIRAGRYTLELSVTDNRGRERRRVQTVGITSP
jgi:hypothetical protein